MSNAAIFLVNRFGVGTATPSQAYKMEVNGHLNVIGNLYDDGSRIYSSPFTNNTTYLKYSAGNLSLGSVNNPSEKLVLDGRLLLQTAGSSSATNGTIRWSGLDFEGYKGGKWTSLTLMNSSATGTNAFGGNGTSLTASATGAVVVGGASNQAAGL